jgi:hypothetical protein
MTMIINKQPDPAPPAPLARPPVLDRPGLEQAERSLCAVRFSVRAILAVVIGGALCVMVIAPQQAGGVALLALLSSIIPWLLIESGILAARACVASAWAARKPDGQP